LAQALLVTALVLVMGCAPVAGQQEAASPPQEPQQPDSVIQVAHDSTSELGSIAEVVARVKPSVVAINTEIVRLDIFNRAQMQQAAGSGWILSADGLIVTNNHVVADADTVTVTLDDGRIFEATEIYTDELTDLAVVRIPAKGLPVAEIGDSSGLRVGDTVVAIGNSLGMGISATAGIASALGVSLQESQGQTLLDLIQTDAAINPGNSGGPLVNMAGRVVGINSVKIATIGVEGMGYAISINQALPIIEALVQDGRVIRPWMGIGVYTLNATIALRYNIGTDSGVLITEVVGNSPAAKAGLRAGDVILELDGTATADVEAFMEVLLAHEVGDAVEVTYWRGRGRHVTTVTLGETPA